MLHSWASPGTSTVQDSISVDLSWQGAVRFGSDVSSATAPASFSCVAVAGATPISADILLTFTQINYPDQTAGLSINTTATAINDLGQITGFFQGPCGPSSFVFGAGMFSAPINLGCWTAAWGINNAGIVAGVTNNGPFLYGAGLGEIVTPPAPAASPSYIAKVNNFGDIVGGYGNLGYGFLCTGSSVETFQFPGARSTDPEGINDQNQIVGIYEDAFGFLHGFLLSPGGIFTSIDVPGSRASQAWDINDAGEIVGDYDVNPRSYIPNGFLFDAGTYYTLNFPGSVQTQVFGINDYGQVVGQYEDATGTYYGFLGTPCTGPSPSCVGLQPASALTSAPEPGSFVLLATLVLTLKGWMRPGNFFRHHVTALRAEDEEIAPEASIRPGFSSGSR